MVGQSLGHYELTTLVGAGGMGEVYQATDTKLGRSVAIKVLPDTFASDADRVARFEREARLLAAVNHPHIAVIHGLEQSQGRTFLVMEFVEGPTLADLVSTHGSGLPLDQVLRLVSQMVDALAAAHDRGVIHRDLKPANIKLTSEGRLKLLDFGLAKAIEEASGADRPLGAVGISQSPTLTSPAMTQAGLILGTAAYMSPEQARGTAVDRRTDVFSFGCVLYEMLTGRQAFESETVPGTLARVIEREPDWTKIPAQTPLALRRLLKRCLVKDRGRRLQHIDDARLDLEDAHTEPESEAASRGGASRSRERIAWVAAGVMGIALAGAVAAAFLRTAEPPTEMRLDLVTPGSLDPFSLALSPDGTTIAFVASAEGQDRLWLRRLDQGTATVMPGTEGAQYPFWSPDSQSIGFFAGGDLKRIDTAGGLPRPLARAAPGGGGSWGPEGQILFAPTLAGGLFRVTASGGGEVSVVTRVDDGSGHLFPQLLPDGRHFLFQVRRDRGIYLAALDNPDSAQLLTRADAGGLYVEPGWLFFLQQGTLLARRLDTARAELTGDAVVVADGLSTNDTLARAFSAASNGMIAYAPFNAASRLTWFDRSGTPIGTIGSADDTDLLDPQISPDGRKVAVTRTRQSNTDIWIFDESRGTRFTLDAANDKFPAWSRDGRQILFQSDRNGPNFDLYVGQATAPGREREVLQSRERKFPSDWSSDGVSVLYFVVSGFDRTTADIDLWVLSLGADRREWLDAPGTELWGQFSPDGRFVVYYSTESSQQHEVYVRRFSKPDDRWAISVAGGVYPRWAPNGRELYYISPDRGLMAVPVDLKGDEIVVGTVTELFKTRIVGGGINRVGRRHQFDVHPDGRFLINVETGGASSSVSLLLNWRPEE